VNEGREECKFSNSSPNAVYCVNLKTDTEICGSHIGLDEDACILGSDGVSTSKYFPKFRRILPPSSSGSSSSRRNLNC